MEKTAAPGGYVAGGAAQPKVSGTFLNPTSEFLAEKESGDGAETFLHRVLQGGEHCTCASVGRGYRCVFLYIFNLYAHKELQLIMISNKPAGFPPSPKYLTLNASFQASGCSHGLRVPVLSFVHARPSRAPRGDELPEQAVPLPLPLPGRLFPEPELTNPPLKPAVFNTSVRKRYRNAGAARGGAGEGMGTA